MNLVDENVLGRFALIQYSNYEKAYEEIKNGKKCTHWMWYIFPQLRGLGQSEKSYYYGISGPDEAREYLAHPVLGVRLIECCKALLTHKDKTAEDVFGVIDDMKLQSSMTLFALVSENDSVFHKVLEQFFDGVKDVETLNIIKRI